MTDKLDHPGEDEEVAAKCLVDIEDERKLLELRK